MGLPSDVHVGGTPWPISLCTDIQRDTLPIGHNTYTLYRFHPLEARKGPIDRQQAEIEKVYNMTTPEYHAHVLPYINTRSPYRTIWSLYVPLVTGTYMTLKYGAI